MSLRQRLLAGGAYLAVRQVLAIGINFAGLLWLSRLIGPENYGLYTAALNIYNYWISLGSMGISVYLTRLESDADANWFDQGWSLLTLLALITTALALISTLLISAWSHQTHFSAVALVFFAGLPLGVLLAVPLAKLERELDFRHIAVVELLGLVAFYAISIALALRGFGVWSPIGGWWGQQLMNCVGYFYYSRYTPRWYWSKPQALEMLRYGFSYSTTTWVYQLRDLVIPLIILPVAGATAVGYIALAQRLIVGLSFVKTIAWRMSIAAMGKIQNEPNKLRQAIFEGMQLQTLALGPLLVGFAWVIHWFLQQFIGPDWTPVAQIYPFLALAVLSNAVFSLHSSALFVLGRNWDVVLSYGLHVALFAGSAWLLVPRIGWLGYGWAEIIAFLGYGLLHHYTARVLQKLDYGVVLIWLPAFALGLFWDQLGWVSLLGMVATALYSGTWRVVGHYRQMLWSMGNGTQG